MSIRIFAIILQNSCLHTPLLLASGLCMLTWECDLGMWNVAWECDLGMWNVAWERDLGMWNVAWECSHRTPLPPPPPRLLLNRFYAAKQAEGKVKQRRPYLASECDDLKKAEKWRVQIIREISKKVSQIQNREWRT